MKHILALFIVLLCLPTLFSCDTTKQQPLLEDLSLPQEDHPQWSELFSSNYTATPLETDSTCMIGVIDKIKKFNNEYYIASSGSSIHRFNNEGKHVMSLNKKGQGPEEYIHVEDFDIYSINGQTEIWISDYENLKIYDANNGSFLRKISFPFTIYKFKRMENGHLLLVTGQNDHFLTLTDEQGNILSEYLEKEVPFLLFRAVQFVKYKNEYLFQLGMSNSYVSFNPETETFSRGVYTPQNDYLTDQQLIELYSTFGIDFIREANNGTHLSNIIPLGNTLWLQIRHADKNYLSKLDNGKMTSTEFTYGSFLSTISVGDSENSLLLYLQPDQLQEIPQKLTDKQGQEIQCQIDDNPVIVEFFNNTPQYTLEATNEYLNIHLDDSTYIPLSHISYFRNDTAEYIAFINKQQPQLIIYNLSKGETYKKITYPTEGDKSIVGYINDFYIKSLDEIYLLSPYTTFLYKSDGNGSIVQKYDFSQTADGEPLTRILSSLGRIELLNSKFYITQNLNRTYGEEIMEKSSLSAIIDTTNNTVELTPVKYPPLITTDDLGTNAGFGYQYRRTFDGKNFIYSFLYSDSIYKVSPDHKTIEKKQIKSKYIPKVEVNRTNVTDSKQIFKMNCEEATYEDIIYDKYREVYYRFACPQTEVDAQENFLEVTRYGKKQFTIVILDKNLNIVGEKLFPEFTYVPTAYIVKEDGLYISCSHFKNPDYTDDILRLQKIKLVEVQP